MPKSRVVCVCSDGIFQSKIWSEPLAIAGDGASLGPRCGGVGHHYSPLGPVPQAPPGHPESRAGWMMQRL